MATHIFDSAIYRNSWGTPELRDLFDEQNRVRGWLEVMAALAEVQGKYHLIPAEAARQLSRTCAKLIIDDSILDEARIGFEETNHSLLGLIHSIQKRCPEESGEWLCYGATVQDITDTQTSLALKSVRKIFLSLIEETQIILCDLVTTHRNTVMCGRTHGQPGLPITFGFKAAVWLDELHRHGERLKRIGDQINIGQLCGGVGSLSSLGKDAMNLQHDFCQRLGLEAPTISWTNSRDRLAEWLSLLAMITATADRVGHEIYNLQRPEIAEVSEGFAKGTIGSITMPQKRNPEISEHLGTLSRVVRYAANQMLENLVHDHERDGRSWKAEWVILPEACLATSKALALLQDLLKNLNVHTDKMLANLDSTKGFVLAESVMLMLANKVGKQAAHQMVYSVCMRAQEQELSLRQAIAEDREISRHLTPDQLEECFDYHGNVGQCATMADRVLNIVDSKRTGKSDAQSCPERKR